MPDAPRPAPILLMARSLDAGAARANGRTGLALDPLNSRSTSVASTMTASAPANFGGKACPSSLCRCGRFSPSAPREVPGFCAEKLRRLIDDDRARATLADRAVGLIRERFDRRTAVPRMEDVYRF
jgi:hypothetical protein